MEAICTIVIYLLIGSLEYVQGAPTENSTGRVLVLLDSVPIPDTGCYDPAEIQLTSPQLIQHRGFPFESHYVITEDGYILELHRIPKPGKPPIIAFHGMFQSSRDFLMNCGRKAFGFYMWDAGFDIWLANVRGNAYSRKHLRFNADKDAAYWDYSVDQVIKYDAPAIIDYVLVATGQPTVSWVGYSLGSAVILGFGSIRPEYSSKVNAAFSLGTTAYVGSTISPLMRLIAPLAYFQDWLMTTFNHGETLPLFLYPIMRTVFPFICSLESKTNSIGLCSFFLFIIAGFDPEQANPSILSLMLGGTPSSISIKMISQWYQWITGGTFSHYDYGTIRNLQLYQRSTPPNYDLRKNTLKIVNIWSDNDWLAPAEDVQRTIRELPNVVRSIQVEHKAWNHLDFIYGKDPDKFVYKHIVNVMKELTPAPKEQLRGMLELTSFKSNISNILKFLNSTNF